MANQLCLLVDDEPPVRTYMKAVLQRQGFRTLESSNGVDALATVQKLGGEIDVVISDICMDKMDGIALMHTLQELFPALPVILMSGFAYVNPSPCHFIGKPFRPDTLLQIVREVLPEVPRAASEDRQP